MPRTEHSSENSSHAMWGRIRQMVKGRRVRGPYVGIDISQQTYWLPWNHPLLVHLFFLFLKNFLTPLLIHSTWILKWLFSPLQGWQHSILSTMVLFSTFMVHPLSLCLKVYFILFHLTTTCLPLSLTLYFELPGDRDCLTCFHTFQSALHIVGALYMLVEIEWQMTEIWILCPLNQMYKASYSFY